MTVSVTFYKTTSGGSEPVGALSWDGGDWSHSKGAEWLMHALKEEIRTRNGVVTAQSDPEKFLELLHTIYSGSYLRAGKAEKTEP